MMTSEAQDGGNNARQARGTREVWCPRGIQPDWGLDPLLRVWEDPGHGIY